MRWNVRCFSLPSIHSRPQCSAGLYGWFTGALRIQVGLRNEGRDLCSGQSRYGTIQQMAVQKKMRKQMNSCKERPVGRSSSLISFTQSRVWPQWHERTNGWMEAQKMCWQRRNRANNVQWSRCFKSVTRAFLPPGFLTAVRIDSSICGRR